MSRFWSPVIAGLTPYVPGEQPKLDNLIKLNTNEHPCGPSPRALAAMHDVLNDSLRLYPDPNADALKTALAAHHGLSSERVFVGNGSDEVLAHAFMALLKHETPLVFPDISYSFYPVYCGLYGIDSRVVPLDDDFSLSVDALIAATPTERTGAIIFPNPNAPTGRALPLSDIERLLEARPNCLVLVDEAYVDFGAESAAALVPRHANLLVVQTFSKSRALAGLRVGYALGDAALIEALERVKNSFNSYPLDRVALAGAQASIEDDDYFRASCAGVIASREKMIAGLERLGFEVVPSAANFVFVRHPRHAGADLAAALRARLIIVRHFKLPRIDNHLRITVGTDDQCAALLAALREICES